MQQCFSDSRCWRGSAGSASFLADFLAAIPGLLLGLWFLSSAESTTTRAILGIVLLVYAIWTLAKGHFALDASMARWLAYPVGFLTGIVNGVTGSQVMPVLPYLLSLNLSKDLFVTTINIFFTVSTLIMLAGIKQHWFIRSEDSTDLGVRHFTGRSRYPAW